MYRDNRKERVVCNPESPVTISRPAERVVSRMVRVNVDTPKSDAMRDLVGDMFHALYDSQFHLREREELRPSRQINRDMLEWLASDDSFDETRMNTAKNILASSTSMPVYYSMISSDEALEEMRKKQEEAAQKEQEAAEKSKEAAEQRAHGNYGAADALQEQADQALADAEAIAQDVNERLDKAKDNPLMRGLIQETNSKAEEAAETANGFARAWGLDPGSMAVHDANDIIEMVNNNRLMANLTEIAEYIGRAEGHAAEAIDAEKRSYHGAVSELTLTKDIRRIVGTERAKLSKNAPPIARITAMRRLFDGSGLVGWQPHEADEKNGVTIALVDQSGSMYGGPGLAANGLALGIAKAVQQSGISKTRTYELWAFSHAGQFDPLFAEDDWKRHIEWVGKLIGGGTDFNGAFKKALERVEHYIDDGVDGADILFITDGIAPLSSETIARVNAVKDKIGMRIFTINIGGYTNDVVKSLSDVFVDIHHQELAKQIPEIAKSIGRQIAKGAMGS